MVGWDEGIELGIKFLHFGSSDLLYSLPFHFRWGMELLHLSVFSFQGLPKTHNKLIEFSENLFQRKEKRERERASVRSRKRHTRRGPPKTLYEPPILRLVPTTSETCVFAGFLTDLVPPTNFSKVVLFLYVKTLWMHEQHVINCESDCFFGIGRSSVIIYFSVGPAIHLIWSYPIPFVSLCCVFGHSFMGQILNNPCTYFWLMCKFFKRVFW